MLAAMPEEQYCPQGIVKSARGQHGLEWRTLVHCHRGARHYFICPLLLQIQGLQKSSGKKMCCYSLLRYINLRSWNWEREGIQNVLPCCHKVNWLQSPFSLRFSSSGRKRFLFLSITASPSSRMSFQFFSKDCWESCVTALRTYCVWFQ